MSDRLKCSPLKRERQRQRVRERREREKGRERDKEGEKVRQREREIDRNGLNTAAMSYLCIISGFYDGRGGLWKYQISMLTGPIRHHVNLQVTIIFTKNKDSNKQIYI